MCIADANIDRTRGRGGQPNHTPGGITRSSLLEVTNGGSLIQASAVSNVLNPAVYPQPDTDLTHNHPDIPYEAELHRSWSNHTTISHDPLLNKDGDALYRFLLSQAATPPQLRLHVHGTHTEYVERKEKRNRSPNRKERESSGERSESPSGHKPQNEEVTVHDFDFSIDITPELQIPPVMWTVPDERPAYRGHMYLEVEADLPSPVTSSRLLDEGLRGRSKANRVQKDNAARWAQECGALGLLLWTDSRTLRRPHHAREDQEITLRSSLTICQWAEQYCASPKIFKKFICKKSVYGWNFDALKAAVIDAVRSTGYRDQLVVRFEKDFDAIEIRANTWQSRLLSKGWVQVLLHMTLVYPFLWLYQRFSSRGGGYWDICGLAYPLVVRPSSFSPGMSTSVQTGMREGEWFQKWEETIKRAAIDRLKSREVISQPYVRPAILLDGYRA